MKRTTNNNAHEPEKLLTPAEVADRLSVSIGWLYRQVEQRELDRIERTARS